MDGLELTALERRELADQAKAALANGVLSRAFSECEFALMFALKSVQITDSEKMSALVAQLQVLEEVKDSLTRKIEEQAAFADDDQQEGDELNEH